ncbi:putative membrane protein [Escherichia coli 2861200]|nr:putative membrane protein [Escherichia coli 2861200]
MRMMMQSRPFTGKHISAVVVRPAILLLFIKVMWWVMTPTY